jgi:hypothetical protein
MIAISDVKGVLAVEKHLFAKEGSHEEAPKHA